MSRNVHGLLLAAGRSSRTGKSHKLLATFDGEPLVRRMALVALGSKVSGLSVVVGHRARDMRAALAGLDLGIIENDAHAGGLSTSLIAGFEASPADANGILVVLADQPFLESRHLDQLVDAFEPIGKGSIVVATDNGAMRNPVLLSSTYADEVMRLRGDAGARGIVAAHGENVRLVEIGQAASLDVDTEEAIQAAGGIPET